VRTYPADRNASELRFGIVVSRFNHVVSLRLLEGCTAELERRGCCESDIHVAWVPGAFEIPQTARILAQSGRYDALVALGAVIRGGTPHFDYVCRAVTDGVREVIRDTGVPVAFGVLTTDDVEQHAAPAGAGNKARSRAGGIEMARLARCSRLPLSRGTAVTCPRRATCHRPREAALQVLFAIDLGRQEGAPESEMSRAEEAFERWLLTRAPGRSAPSPWPSPGLPLPQELDADSPRTASTGASSGWPRDRTCGSALVRSSSPYARAIAIDEAVELAQRFGGERSPGFVTHPRFGGPGGWRGLRLSTALALEIETVVSTR
jgi:6,7-dimethyl-8-ribityllumazine synthase